MEEIQSLTEDLRFMVHFDPEALPGVQMAETLLQLLFDLIRVEEPCRGAKSIFHSWFPKVVLPICSY